MEKKGPNTPINQNHYLIAAEKNGQWKCQFYVAPTQYRALYLWIVCKLVSEKEREEEGEREKYQTVIKKKSVRSGIRTHAHIRGPEPSTHLLVKDFTYVYQLGRAGRDIGEEGT